MCNLFLIAVFSLQPAKNDETLQQKTDKKLIQVIKDQHHTHPLCPNYWVW